MGNDEQSLRGLLIQCQAEIQAVSLLVNEALSLVLSLEADPHNATAMVRRDVEEMAGKAQAMAENKKRLTETQQWFFKLVHDSLARKLDALEKRVSSLDPERTTH